MPIYQIRSREEIWYVNDIEADNEDKARHIVESMTSDELKSTAVDSGCNFCGVEDIQKLEN